MEQLPHNLSRGDRLSARFINELVRRVERIENTHYNQEHFQTKQTATGMTRELSPDLLRRLGRGTSTSTPTTQTCFGYIVGGSQITPMVSVQFLKHSITIVDGVQISGWAKDGDPRAAWLIPNAKVTDLGAIVRTQFTSTTPIVRLDRVNNVWYVTWVPRWVVRDSNTTLNPVRCI